MVTRQPRIIAVTIFEKAEDKVGVVSVNTRDLRVVPLPGGGKWPSWSRDGEWLYSQPPENLRRFGRSGLPEECRSNSRKLRVMTCRRPQWMEIHLLQQGISRTVEYLENISRRRR